MLLRTLHTLWCKFYMACNFEPPKIWRLVSVQAGCSEFNFPPFQIALKYIFCKIKIICSIKQFHTTQKLHLWQRNLKEKCIFSKINLIIFWMTLYIYIYIYIYVCVRKCVCVCVCRCGVLCGCISTQEHRLVYVWQEDSKLRLQFFHSSLWPEVGNTPHWTVLASILQLNWHQKITLSTVHLSNHLSIFVSIF